MPKTTLSKTILFSVTLGLLMTLGKGILYAQTILPLTVAPAIQQITLDAGQSETSVIKFFNGSIDPVAGTIKAVDFIVTDKEGSPVFLENGEIPTKYSAVKWIKLPFDKATIAAGAVLRVPFDITAPKTANPGGHYVAIMFEQTNAMSIVNSAPDIEQGLMAISPRIVGLVNIKINGIAVEDAFVSKFTVPSFLEFGPIKVSAEILNRGDNHITPKGTISLYNLSGRLIDQKTLETKNIFPSTSRIYDSQLGKKVLIGKFKVVLNATYGEAGKVLTAQSTLWVFPWSTTLAVLLGIAIIILLVWFIWNQLKKRQKKLEEKLKQEIEAIDTLKEKYKDVITGTPQTPTGKPENKK